MRTLRNQIRDIGIKRRAENRFLSEAYRRKSLANISLTSTFRLNPQGNISNKEKYFHSIYRFSNPIVFDVRRICFFSTLMNKESSRVYFEYEGHSVRFEIFNIQMYCPFGSYFGSVKKISQYVCVSKI